MELRTTRDVGAERKKAFLLRTAAAIMIASGICSLGIFACAEFIIKPNLDDIAKVRAEAVVSRTVNEALAEQLKDSREGYELFRVIRDSEGSMEMIQADSYKINVMMAELSIKLQEHFRKMDAEMYGVPTGTLLGSKVLSQVGPETKIRIIPMSVSSMDFRTEFESRGINQTKYKIYIELECQIKVLAPFSAQTFDTDTTILVGETVILGKVPNSYVEVPEEDILDVIEE